MPAHSFLRSCLRCELVGEGSLEWIALSIHGFKIRDLKAVVLDARLRAFSVEELFSVCAVKVEPFVTLPYFKYAPIVLHGSRGHFIVVRVGRAWGEVFFKDKEKQKKQGRRIVHFTWYLNLVFVC